MQINWLNFLTLLSFAVIITGFFWFFERYYQRPKYKKKTGKKDIKLTPLPGPIEFMRSLFPVLLAVLIIRSFIIQPWRVPTGSLEPTIQPGDFILVNQFSYGLRLPVTNTKIFNIGEPKVGDIAVFRFPPNPNIDYIKRVIGVPGDHVQYIDKVLYINGKRMPQKLISQTLDNEPGGGIPSLLKQEDLNGVKHDILIHKFGGKAVNFDLTVPKGYYFMMGDNRDNSGDSRFWGFVPEKNLIGKAFMVFMSWNNANDSIRWSRIGNRL